MAKISVLGAGSWGTALSILLYNNGHEVILWSALGEEITTLREKREHVSKLPGVKIPEPIDITIDLERSLRDADVAILAVPSPYTRSTCKRMAPFVKNGQKIVNVAKGVEEKTLLTLSDTDEGLRSLITTVLIILYLVPIYITQRHSVFLDIKNV